MGLKPEWGKHKKIVATLLLLVGLGSVGFITLGRGGEVSDKVVTASKEREVEKEAPAEAAPETVPSLSRSIPSSKILANNYHIFQTFNNCGPAALSMALSYYGIQESQQSIGLDLRPYQNPQGNNDDKSVTLEELAEKSKEYDMTPFHRPNGNIDIIKKFIANDIPVITRTWLKADDDIGHYRVVKGYDERTGQLIQDDSLQGKDLKYTYSEFNVVWEKFNYEYLALVPKDKEGLAREILGDNYDVKTSWEIAVGNSLEILSKDPNDIYARFNLSVAYYHTGKYRESVNEFEKVQSRLPMRTLWYQIEPILAYYELKEYDKVFSVTDSILNNHNRAFSELYIIRGNVYIDEGNTQMAKREFEKAVLYNVNLEEAREALAKLN